MGRLIDACEVIEKINCAIELLGIASKTSAENEGFQTTIKAYIDVRDAIMQEPTAEPEHKTGKWISVGERCGEPIWQCSECKVEEAVPTATSFITGISYAQWHYCPNCGVKMEEEQNG